MSKAEIKCLHSAVWPVSDFIPNPRNPNRHPEAQIQLLGRILTTSGWRSPIVVSQRSGMVVKGHGRLAAAIAAGLTEAPVEIQAYATEAEEWSDMVADNRLAELAEPDNAAILGLLSEIEGQFDISLTGFTDAEFQALKIAPEEAAEPESGETPPAPAAKFLRFGKQKFPMIDEEFAELCKRADAYRAKNGTSYGFVREILGMQ